MNTKENPELNGFESGHVEFGGSFTKIKLERVDAHDQVEFWVLIDSDWIAGNHGKVSPIDVARCMAGLEKNVGVINDHVKIDGSGGTAGFVFTVQRN